jgi:hypothetical protein
VYIWKVYTIIYLGTSHHGSPILAYFLLYTTKMKERRRHKINTIQQPAAASCLCVCVSVLGRGAREHHERVTLPSPRARRVLWRRGGVHSSSSSTALACLGSNHCCFNLSCIHSTLSFNPYNSEIYFLLLLTIYTPPPPYTPKKTHRFFFSIYTHTYKTTKISKRELLWKESGAMVKRLNYEKIFISIGKLTTVCSFFNVFLV